MFIDTNTALDLEVTKRLFQQSECSRSILCQHYKLCEHGVVKRTHRAARFDARIHSHYPRRLLLLLLL